MFLLSISNVQVLSCHSSLFNLKLPIYSPSFCFTNFSPSSRAICLDLIHGATASSSSEHKKKLVSLFIELQNSSNIN
ncbi:hypothetical protein BpHYR1_012423 [Brachionus plicatilis]|uniref:Uncharacterized protein n=1 Tax=Brachionus plicatilis TaxID=10195 RepID=A0A3M7SNC0_BRAPC|nr:hypothetical protein BpHYR1_012423 [Brachionus plicatilis]